jgi:hypothetical protein
MIKHEIQSLTRFKGVEAIFAIFITIAVSSSAYFLDSARVAAFGIIPAISIVIYGRHVGITWKSTPRLFVLIILAAIILYSGSLYWVILNPKI